MSVFKSRSETDAECRKAIRGRPENFTGRCPNPSTFYYNLSMETIVMKQYDDNHMINRYQTPVKKFWITIFKLFTVILSHTLFPESLSKS